MSRNAWSGGSYVLCKKKINASTPARRGAASRDMAAQLANLTPLFPSFHS
jgi:hypothetical protein